MYKKMFMVFIFLFLAMGYVTLASAQTREGTDGTGIPAITQSYASKEVRPGDTWKVYLNVSDPEGNIKRIFAQVDQTGVGAYPITSIWIRGDNNKELSGFIYLNTSAPGFSGQFVKLTLTVHAQNKAGNFSKPAVFPLFIQQRATIEAPPQGVFKEQAIGPIMVQLQNVPGGVSGSAMSPQ
jgi:hypothetical protein